MQSKNFLWDLQSITSDIWYVALPSGPKVGESHLFYIDLITWKTVYVFLSELVYRPGIGYLECCIYEITSFIYVSCSHCQNWQSLKFN
jgi:hypothetical protein